VAVDGDAGAVERARARYRRSNLEFRPIPSDPAALGERFEVVVVPEAEGLIRRAEAVMSWKRLLAPGGRVLVAVTSADRQAAGGGRGRRRARRRGAPGCRRAAPGGRGAPGARAAGGGRGADRRAAPEAGRRERAVGVRHAGGARARRGDRGAAGAAAARVRG